MLYKVAVWRVLFWGILSIRQIHSNKTLANISRYTVFFHNWRASFDAGAKFSTNLDELILNLGDDFLQSVLSGNHVRVHCSFFL